MNGADLHLQRLGIRTHAETPAKREAARIEARRRADMRHRAAPAPLHRLFWEAVE